MTRSASRERSRDRIAPDDHTIASGRDGALALWQAGTPHESAQAFTDVPDWVTVDRVPVKERRD